MSDANQFEAECLQAHNEYRAMHHSTPLRLNRNLCNYAQQWAENLASRNTMCHRQNNSYGENIYMASGLQVSGRTAVKSWYDEVARYQYNNACFGSATGHFTQVVWKDSKELGVGVAKRGSSTWVVANYDPPGNMYGQFSQNVQRK